jgi:hypothetical protein
MRQSIFRPELQGQPKFRDGSFKILYGEEAGAEVIVGVSVIGLQLHRRAVFPNGFRQLAFRPERVC